MINQLQQLQCKKDAAIVELNKLKRQQAHSTGLLHQAAANIQNTAKAATNPTQQLAGSVSQQLNKINDALNQGFGRINKDLRHAFLNQNILYETAERRYQEYDRQFGGIENQLRRLQVQPEST